MRGGGGECGGAAQGAGHDVEPSYPADLDDPDYIANFLVRWTAAVDWNLKYWGTKLGRELGPDDVEPLTWALAEQGKAHSAGDLLRAVEAAQSGSRRIASWWADDGFDLLLTPTCAEPPPRLGEHDPPPDNPLAPIVRATPFAVFTAGFNTTGQPGISLPLHVTWKDSRSACSWWRRSAARTCCCASPRRSRRRSRGRTACPRCMQERAYRAS